MLGRKGWWEQRRHGLEKGRRPELESGLGIHYQSSSWAVRPTWWCHSRKLQQQGQAKVQMGGGKNQKSWQNLTRKAPRDGQAKQRSASGSRMKGRDKGKLTSQIWGGFRTLSKGSKVVDAHEQQQPGSQRWQQLPSPETSVQVSNPCQ